MPQKKKIRSSRRVKSVESKSSVKSDNVHITLTPSIFQKVPRSLARSSSRIRAEKSTRGLPTVTNRMPTLPTSGVLENTAVHFGHFYDLQMSPNFGYVKSNTRKIEPLTNGSLKAEFTRQMVHQLERLAGTKRYARQVSALLEETVEPADFKVRPPPADNCVPYGKLASSYPLWYKDPNEMPYSATGEYRSVKEKYGKSKQETKKMDVIERLTEDEQNVSDFENDSEEDDAESMEESTFGGHFFKYNFEPANSLTSGRSTTMTMGNSVESAKFVKSSKVLKVIHLGDDADSKDEDEENSSDWETIGENNDLSIITNQ